MASQHHHHSHAHSDQDLADHDLITSARKVLEDAGGQWTSMRQIVFEELLRSPRPASAYAIADDVSKRLDKRVAANSIYRILDLFVEHRLALRVESANAYLASMHPGAAHDCIFLVCDECGDASHVDDDSVSQRMRAIASEQSFATSRSVLEIRGLCTDCA